MGDSVITRSFRAPAAQDIKPLLAVLEQWHGAVLLFDAEARLHWCNAAARQLASVRREELRGMGAPGLGLAWIMAPEQFIAALSGTELKFRSGPQETPQRYDVRLRRVDMGSSPNAVLCIVEPHAAATQDVSGSEREQSFDAAQAGVWRWNLEKDEASVDHAWCRHQRLNPCDGFDHATRWAQQIHPDDAADYRRRLNELQSGATAYFEDEYRILTLENRWIWILQRGRVVARAAEGAPLRVIGICIDIDRRKREETASKSNESRLATALWGARAAFWQWHLPTDVRTMSPMWFAMTRYTRDQWDKTPNPWLSRLHAEDRDAIIKIVDDYRGGVIDSLEYEYRLKVANGEWKWMLDRARAVEWDLEGNPTMIMGVSLDIDAQKRAEVALRTSELRLQTAVWGARMGLWETDIANDTTRWLDDWCAQYGIDPCEGTDHHQRWLAKVHPGDAAGMIQQYQDHLNGKQDFYDSEYRVMTKEGQWRWIYARARVTERDEKNTPLRMVGVCMDVDERRQSQMQKHFTQPWLESALTIARGAMWHWQVTPFEVSYTDSYYQMFGFDPLKGRTETHFWDNNIHPDDRERAMHIARTLLAGYAEQYEQEYRMRCADGRWMWVLDRACAVKWDEAGKAAQMVGFVIDFTERRAQREALQASEELFRHATVAGNGMVFEVDFLRGKMTRYGSERLLGYADCELGTTRQDWISKMHPDDVPGFTAMRPANTNEGHSEVVEYRIRHKNGEWLWLRGSGITFTDGNGRPMRRVGFVRRIDRPDPKDSGSQS